MFETIAQIGPLFYPLLGLSLLGSALIAERLIFFIRLPQLEDAKSFKLLNKELEENKSLAKPIRDEILSFRLIDLQAKLTHGIHMLRWSAMLTTAYGLLIALPCLFMAFIYTRMAEKRLERFQKHLNTQSLKLEGAKLSTDALT